jgi:type II secretory pathway component PulJ
MSAHSRLPASPASSRDGGRFAPHGLSLVELIVSLSVLMLCATVSFGVLASASRNQEEAELTLRAVLYLSELSLDVRRLRSEVRDPRSVGPGELTWDRDRDDSLIVRYDPPRDPTTVGLRSVGYGREYLWVAPWPR